MNLNDKNTVDISELLEAKKMARIQLNFGLDMKIEALEYLVGKPDFTKNAAQLFNNYVNNLCIQGFSKDESIKIAIGTFNNIIGVNKQ